MRSELEEIKRLEDFIQGNLSEDNTQDLEIRLLWDEVCQVALNQQKLAYQAIQAAGRQQLRTELKAIHASLFFKT